ncbi:MAG: Phosphopantothenoylcysteine decarboxylase/phosphopantothenate-cysteine ligase [candidate division Zixibacteria bacterium RBG-1]|nr:MAG: Phosphopantothenoylcysteine decarboxylase/phosphopantothenate-cysteine ligase [candidate division Zixibacteria bacterium RBG-1]OGC83747.1 MAG: hypothetical protein A2V73_02235 [candidate division Zixibacteria bacterium RBG_19FT_COMBO_42_43]
MLSGKKIILGVTGGIAVYKSCEIVRKLVSLNAEVTVIMTQSAQKFVTPLTFETLSGKEVVTEMFPENKFVATHHISLAQWADLILIAPATANLIGKIRGGIADDILTTVIISARSPIVIAPAMNVKMYENPIVQENIAHLKKLGYRFIDPEVGDLACREEGQGRLAEPEKIVEYVVKMLLPRQDLAGKKILVTAGGTKEPIDPVRFISNRSSGKMGYALASEALKRGAKVTLISTASDLTASPQINLIPVSTTEEMFKAVKSHLDKNDILFMTAAVSDFQPKLASHHKIKKNGAGKVLELSPSVDILKEISKNKNGKILIGFSLETDNQIENAKKKMKDKKLDMVIVNGPEAIGSDSNQATLINGMGKLKKLPLMPKTELANKILDEVLYLIKK